jgi:DNA-binding transcriptional ArsR family regulator
MVGASGEDFLSEQGLIHRRSATRRVILGCIACRLKACQERGQAPRVYGEEIARCTSMATPVIYQHLRLLKVSGLLTQQEESGTSQRPSRFFYSPRKTQLAKDFEQELAAPLHCGLESADGEPTESDALHFVSAITSPQLLRCIIEMAQTRLSQLNKE